MKRLIDLLSYLAFAGGVFQLVILYWVFQDTNAFSKTPVLCSLYTALALATVLFSALFNYTELKKERRLAQ